MLKYFKKIEFWIFLFFIIRLWGITDPPLEAGHHWRQVTGLMVSRNFLEVDSNIFFPRVDENNGGTGIIGMEFPVLNYLHFLLSFIFGYQHWYGRLINLVASSLGIFFFYKLIKDIFNENHAFYSTIGLLASTWFVFSRKMMPDTFCMALMFIGLYFGYQFLIKNSWKNLLLFFLFTSLASLAKIPAIIGFSFVLLFWFKLRPPIKIMMLQSVFMIFTLSFVYLWYFIWNPFLSETYGNWYNLGKSFSQGLQELSQNLPKIMENFYFHSFNSFILLGLSIYGFIQMLKLKEKYLIFITILYSGVFGLYAIKSGHFFYHHNYYMIPFIPIMALWLGFGLQIITNPKIKVFILCVGILESIANQQHDFFIKSQEYPKLELEKIFDGFSSKTDLIAVNGNGNPQLIYLTHRKGWNANNEDFKNLKFLQNLQNKGCKWILIEKNEWIQSLNNFQKVFENERFIIYKAY